MATDVIYGGVQMHNVITREWRQEIVYDESGTDPIYSRFFLDFEGIIHLQVALTALTQSVVFTSVAAAVPPGSAVQLYRQIQACLWEPRQLLLVNFNNELVLRALHVDAGTDADCDVDNGPKPRQVSLTHVVSNNLFKVRFAIEVCKVECCSDVGASTIQAGKPPQFILSNRWSISETLNDNFYTTRTIRGKIRTSQAMAANLFTAKPAIVPTLETGFKRESIEFAVLPNGLEADYTVTDRQVATSAPFPATKISGHFIESLQNATMRFSELHVRLEGPPNVDKRVMMQRAAQIAFARLGTEQQIANSASILEEIVFVEEIGELNAIELRARLNRVPGSDAGGGAFIGNLPASTWGQPLSLPGTPTNYDPSLSPVPAVFGYTSGAADPRDPTVAGNPAIILFAMRCFLQTPCDANHLMQQVTGMTSGTDKQQSGTPAMTAINTQTVSSLPTFTGSSLVNQAAAQNIYRYAHYSSVYKTRRLRVGLPVAGDVTDFVSDATRFVSLGRAQCCREITVDAERVGAPPLLPSPEETYTDGQITGRLLEHHVEPFPSTLSVDGTQRIFRARGFYRYGLNRAPLPTETLLVGKLPFTTVNQDAERFNAVASYDPNLGPGDGAASGVVDAE